MSDDLSNVADLPPRRSKPTTRRTATTSLPSGPEVWLKGSTHVHARASGDSSEPNANVIAWYEQHHYDFIALTDHNRVSELDPSFDTRGQITLRDPHAGLIVLSGIELTHNPIGCLPVGDRSRNCRIHVNLLGPTARPGEPDRVGRAPQSRAARHVPRRAGRAGSRSGASRRSTIRSGCGA